MSVMTVKLSRLTTVISKRISFEFQSKQKLLSRRYGSHRDIQLLDNLIKVQKSKRVASKAKSKSTISTIPSTIHLHVLGNGSEGSSRCLYVSTSNGSYMFNCGEGTERLSYEHKFKLSQLEHIFITYKNWRNFGGVLGLSLKAQEMNIPNIFLHGPPSLNKLFDAMKCFVYVKDYKVAYKSHENETFADHSMEVKYVPLLPRLAENGTTKDKSNNSQYGARQKSKSGDDVTREVSVAYICKFHDKPGQLLLKKCVDYEVPPGPLLGKLENGEDITLPNGQIVRSQDVVAPTEPGPIFIVLECPSVNYLDSLLNEKAFEAHQSVSSSKETHASVVVHFTENDILLDPRYQQWMSRFPTSTVHLVLNLSNASLSSIAVHRIQHMLHLIHPRIFPLLKNTDEMVPSVAGNCLMVPSESLVSFSLRPKDGLNREMCIKLDKESLVQKAVKKMDFANNLQELRNKLSEENLDWSNNFNYPEITFLGTGSSIPSVFRNVSGILVNIDEETSMLLDCGEGSYIQLYRLFGSENIKHVIKRIRCIFISHIHADHHLGLVQLLKTRMEVGLGSSPLFLLAPFHVIQWLSNYHCGFEPVLNDVTIILNINAAFNREKKSPHYAELLQTMKLKEITTVPVKHCKDAHAVVFTTLDDYKVVYSGDTMPCDSLIKAGRDCSLLIHEATLDDDLEEDAKIKSHSTISQAIDVGKRMGARFTILTHFSQRYSKAPVFLKNSSDAVGFAFDNMVVRPCDLKLLPLFLPCLKSLFAAEHYEEMQRKTARRVMRLQLLEEMMQPHANM